jgi:NAD(P)-dependent dehydrogenase (short-subunit alcohol dehydrogenase family)
LPAKVDVTNPASLRTLFSRLASQGLKIVGLVNNAGLHVDAASADMSLEEWHQVMDTNATSVVSVSQAAYPHLVAAGGGMIVNIGSFFETGRQAQPGLLC